MIVKKTSDIIVINVGGLIVKVSPLTQLQKAAVQVRLSSSNLQEALLGTSLAIKYALKDVEGLKNVDGSDYVIERDDNGLVADSVVDDLSNLPISEKLMVVAMTMLNNIPNEFIDPETNKKLKGVEIMKGDKPGKKS